MLRQILLLSSFGSLLAGCASKEQIEYSISTQNSPTFASTVCFDIGSGINSNGITDDYMTALKVKTPTECTYRLADRTTLNEKEKILWLINSFEETSKKDFLSDSELVSVKENLVSLRKNLADIETQEAIKLATLEQKWLKQKEVFDAQLKKEKARKDEEIKKNAIEREIKELELCGINGLKVGVSEACLLHVKGVFAFDRETTESLSGKYVFYRFFNLLTEDWEYAEVRNGVVVSLRY